VSEPQAAKAKESLQISAAVLRGLRESYAIALAVLALILLVALLSYNVNDPSWSYSGGNDGVHNRIGRFGAWSADLLYYLFGKPGYLLPLSMAFAAARGFRAARASVAVSSLTHVLRMLGLVLLLVASCGLATLHWHADVLRASAGGVVGMLAGNGLADALQLLGATLVLLAVWASSFVVATGISWLTIMDALGRWTWQAVHWLQARRAATKQMEEGKERKQARKEVVETEQKKAKPRIAPKIEPPAPAPVKSARAEQERQVPLFDAPAAGELPPLSLLDDPGEREASYSPEALEAMSRLVELKLRDFGVEVEVVAVHPGPVVTRFEMRPAPGVKASQITALAKDLARALSTSSVRVVEVIPGKPVMGLELPNERREIVTLGEIIKSKAYDDVGSPLALALGKDIGGLPVVADLARMPHLLIAGTTGSGKSVGINAMLLSLLYKSTAEHVRLILIDPKMLELSVYEGIPQLLAPVVTDMKHAANALRWCVGEMDRRYALMSALGVRNIAGYNRKVKDASDAGKPILDPLLMQLAANDPTIDQKTIPVLEPLPFIVVFIDELADLMMIVGKKVEELIARLAQKARASGIHLILATQRPSVDVITGLIKANIPTRIAFQVSARVDSRTILDQMGAESLLGHGDMLYLPPGTAIPTRVHGAFVSDAEVHRVVSALKHNAQPKYIDAVLEGPSQALAGISGEQEEYGSREVSGGDAEQDPLYDEAVQIVLRDRKPSISYVQRRLKIGYNRSARLVEAMEAAGVVGPLQPNGSREVLAPAPKDQ
jgi:DNA segregation ATPase FtsK/SpoIIIE, S-DNA-T family